MSDMTKHICAVCGCDEWNKVLQCSRCMVTIEQSPDKGEVDEAMLGQVSRLMNTCEAYLDKGYGSSDEEVAFYHDTYGALYKLNQLLQSQPVVDEDVAYWMDLAHDLGEKLNEANKPKVVTRDTVINVLTDIIDLHSEEGTGWEPLFERLKGLGLEVKE